MKCFFRELTAYSREVFLYPEQHPRLVARTQSLGETVVSFVSSRDSALYFQVREGTLFSGNEAVDTGDEAAPQLAAFLQERMVQLVCILPQATAEEVLELVRFLIDPERVACSGIEGLRKIDLGANIVLYRFPRKFSESGSPVSEEEIVAQAELGDAEAEDVGLDGEEWLRFSKEQLQSVREILRSPQVRRRLSNILDSAGEVCAKESGDAGGDVDGGGDRSGHGRGEGDGDREGDGEDSSELAGHEVSAGFVPCFFELLRSDPRINWKDSEQLLRSVEASLDLLEKAKSFKESEQGVPLHLLHVPRGQPDLLGEDFRWQLLRNFAPRDFLPEPRAAVDLATPAEPGARAEAGLQGGWQAPDLAFLREEFADFFERKRFLCEYAATATHLVNQR
ncbi:MAG: hypothetical protein JXA90_05720, partial [Planctomycetes bacterium]|nr:hypothetical protein [Planctomycetota bacterium]